MKSVVRMGREYECRKILRCPWSDLRCRDRSANLMEAQVSTLVGWSATSPLRVASRYLEYFILIDQCRILTGPIMYFRDVLGLSALVNPLSSGMRNMCSRTEG